MVLIAASFNSTFKHTVEVANYHMKAFRCCERAKAGLENAIGSVNTERMKLYAGRKAKHVGLWKQMSEFIGLDTDTSFSATLHHYDLQTASLRKLDQIQKEISLAEQGFERERALWYGASETLQEVFGVVIEDLGATRGSQLCLSVDQFESLVMRILKERSLVKEKGEVLYEIIAFDESNCDSPRSEFSKHGQNLIVGGWFSKAAVDEILGMFAMDTAANNRTRRLAMTATPSSHPLRTVKDNNTMSSVSHMFVWGVTLALIARPWLTGDQPTIHWKLFS
ncbi:hypothetical protein BM1_02273 [Bipolaris maydis]|nr:hypothetical protein BM1_02273 [Bipolaris maydis]